ncbi:MAG: hypothetical protein CL940_06435 [Deltaproteobacteria bacterium]|nr:hypothetical protein [Deltaproteobacteria bacterium]
MGFGFSFPVILSRLSQIDRVEALTMDTLAHGVRPHQGDPCIRPMNVPRLGRRTLSSESPEKRP